MKKIKIIALFAAIVACLGIYQFLNIVSKPAEPPRTNVVVAVSDIPENTLITQDMVTLQPVVTEALSNGYLTETESAVGMVSKGEIFAGEQVISNRLVHMGETEAEGNSLAYVVEPGKRAITISAVGNGGMMNLLKPGNHVDLILNYGYDVKETENTKAEQLEASKMFIEDVEILAVDSILSKSGSAEGYSTVTLMVTPKEAVKISFAEATGTIRLILRSSIDDEKVGGIKTKREDIRKTGSKSE